MVQLGNPYRRPKPANEVTLLSGKFHLANEKGTHFEKQYIHPRLCSDYLWLSELLSIPVSAILDLGLTKRGGYIKYFDAIAQAPVVLYFTKVAFLRYRQRDVITFLEALKQQLSSIAEYTRGTPNATAAAEKSGFEISQCERCQSDEFSIYNFRVFLFVGIIPVAYLYRLTPTRFVLCREHARQQCVRSCLQTALQGYWGFPGFLAAPWYIVRNLFVLVRNQALSASVAAICVFVAIGVPLAAITGLVLLIVRSAKN